MARAALRALLQGPTAAERHAGLVSEIPAGTALNGVTVAGGVATVDLNRRFETGGGSTSMLLRVAQVVYTTTQFETVHKVEFRIAGRAVTAIGGEGVVVSPPVGRADFEAQTPPVLLEQPLSGDTVASLLLVRGTANVFEGRLVVEVRTMTGRVLSRRLVSASSGTGTRGSFRLTIKLPTAPPRLQIVAYVRSPKNGAPMDVVRMSVIHPARRGA